MEPQETFHNFWFDSVLTVGYVYELGIYVGLTNYEYPFIFIKHSLGNSYTSFSLPLSNSGTL